LVISLELLNAWGMQVKYHSSPHIFPFWLLQSYLLLPPSIWLFTQLNTDTNFAFSKKHLLLYIPAGIDVFIKITWHVYKRYIGTTIHLLDITPWFLFAEILPIIWTIYVLFIYAKKLIAFSRQQNTSAWFSPIYFLKIYGLFTFLLLLTLLWVAGVLFNMQIFSVVELLITSFLFSLGYIGYFNPTFFEVPAMVQRKTTEKDALTFPNYNDPKELNRLAQIFEQHALHTRSKLSLEELAGELKLPSRYVSYLINTYHSTNFHHFVNSYRVKEVMRKMEDPAEQHKTLLALALESGFNSKSSFNQVFKSLTGQSPSEYLLLCKK
jgi:AraC-like DNA-binding protein